MDSSLCPSYYRDASVDSALAATQSTISHIATIDAAHSLITPILTPRFALSCSGPLMHGLGQIHAQTELPIQTHISENTAEIATALSQFPEHGSYAEIYDAAGLLTSRTVLAHGVHLNNDEVGLIQQRGAAIAHCPISNSCLGSGICPVRELLDAQVPVGLGTDVSGGYTPSILAACREAGTVSRLRTAPGLLRESKETSGSSETEDRARLDRLKLSVEETLHLATRGGARCLGLQQRVGGFSVGMEWDAQFVELGREISWEGEAMQSALDGRGEAMENPLDGSGAVGNVEVYEGMTWSERLAKWVFCGDERNTRAVWVKGRLVSGEMERVQ
jgi:guanine deaminase